MDLAVCGAEEAAATGHLPATFITSARKTWVGKNPEGINYSVEIMQLACKR